ncbi:MAG: pitrilysin family protein, partial [Candidatus Omnitrophota bacterium]
PYQYLDTVLEVLADMVLHPLLMPEEINKEKAVILEEIKMYKDQPQSYVYELLDELLWPAHPLGQPIIGTTESVSQIKREELLSFKERYYSPFNIVVSAAGRLSHNKLARAVGKAFSSKAKEKRTGFLKAVEAQGKAQLKILIKDTEQTHMALGFHALSRSHPLRHALGLLNIILGANMSSRLFNELREKKGLAYEIGSGVKRFYDTGAFLVHAGIDNRKVGEAIRLILAELNKTKDELVTQDEFRRAKEFYIGQLVLMLEDTLDHMLWIGESQVALDRTFTGQAIIKEVKKLKREDIRKVAGMIFCKEKINIALIGPSGQAQDELYNSLKLD